MGRRSLDALVGQLIAAGTKGVDVQGNVANAEDCKRLINAAAENLSHLDALVNNAAGRGATGPGQCDPVPRLGGGQLC
jgi:NAD(P)-dependent dehydrogenase (short-subunit alcohol dehydrogenase family)